MVSIITIEPRAPATTFGDTRLRYASGSAWGLTGGAIVGVFALHFSAGRVSPYRCEVSKFHPPILILPFRRPCPHELSFFVRRLQQPASNLPMCQKGPSLLGAGDSGDGSRITWVNAGRGHPPQPFAGSTKERGRVPHWFLNDLDTFLSKVAPPRRA